MSIANAFSRNYVPELNLKDFAKRKGPITETNAVALNKWSSGSINTESKSPADKSHALRKGTLNPQSKTPTNQVGASNRSTAAKEIEWLKRV